MQCKFTHFYLEINPVFIIICSVVIVPSYQPKELKHYGKIYCRVTQKSSFNICSHSFIQFLTNHLIFPVLFIPKNLSCSPFQKPFAGESLLSSMEIAICWRDRLSDYSFLATNRIREKVICSCKKCLCG